MFHSINPYTQEIVDSHEVQSPDRVDGILRASQNAFEKWSGTQLDERKRVIARIGEELDKSRLEFAALITGEMGKPVTQSLAEVDKCVWLCRHYSTYSLGVDENVDAGDDLIVDREFSPLGAILGIMPWNFPLWQALRYAIPSLYMGNVVLLKPAPNVFGTSRRLETLLQEVCGQFANVFQVLIVDVDQIDRIIANPAVQGVTFTGSNRAGGVVASLAGKYLKKSVLELGGSDPFVVFADAEIKSAASAFVTSRMNNNGQTCIAAKRAIVQKSILADFTDEVSGLLDKLKQGDPVDSSTYISCIARDDLAQQLVGQIDASRISLNPLVKGGRVAASNVYLPELYSTQDHTSAVWTEELFGPVALVTSFGSHEEAVQLANATEYGLGASIWTADVEFGRSLAKNIEAGSIHINKTVSSDPRVPFGGIKASGYGRELGRDGLLEFVNHKWITSKK